MRILLLLVMLLWPCFVKGVSNSQHLKQDPPPITITQGCPSAIVGGVSTIAGVYCDREIDLVIPGVEPLVYERRYLSLGYDWSDSHGGFLGYIPDDYQSGRPHKLIAKFANPDGSFLVSSWKTEKKPG